MVKNIAKIILVLFVIGVCCAVPYVYSVISSSGVSEAITYNRLDTEENFVSFEEGGLLKVTEFDYFREFSNDERFDEYIYKNLKKFKSDYEVVENFKLKTLKRNDCKRNRCLQYKVSFPEIPVLLSKGLIGIEDYRFLDHFGVDPVSILRALYQDIKAGKLVQGGSTLTQQLAKNLFFSNEKTLVRKVKEAILAIYIESRFDKSDILRTYFNEVYWGALQGIRIKGVQAASHVYFGKALASLSAYESSILVSMLKGPHYYHPIRRTERLKQRANFIYKKLGDLGLYQSDDKWNEVDWDKWVNRLKELDSNYYLESVYINSSLAIKSNQYRHYKLVIESKSLLASKLDVNKNLSVKAVFGNREETTIYYSRFERDLERAITKERHQIGSTIKPVLYNFLVKLGLDMDDTVDMEPLTMVLKSGKWSPRESHQIAEKEISYKRALRESFNNPIIKATQEIGFDKMETELLRVIPTLKVPLSEYPAQLLGAVELSVQELYELYLDFIKNECSSGMSVISVLADPTKTTIKRIVSKQLAAQNFFGKTGTTNNGFDNWFIGFDGHDLFVIWVGYEGNRNEVKSLPLYGSTTSFKIFQNVILYSGKRIGVRNCIF